MTDSPDVIQYYKSKIIEYKDKRKNCSIDSVVKYVLEQDNIENAICKAVMSKNKYGKKHAHQKRLPNDCLKNYAQILLKIKNKISQIKSFNSLFMILEQNRINGAGELLVYDVSLRIGAFLKIYPETVYIHAGTRIGLQNLLKRKIHEKQMKKDILPEPFCSCDLTPGQLEDFFCIYKDIFSNNTNKKNNRINIC